MASLWVSALQPNKWAIPPRKQNWTNLKILIYNVFDGEKSSKKNWGKKMFYKLFGSKQNSALNGRDV